MLTRASLRSCAWQTYLATLIHARRAFISEREREGFERNRVTIIQEAGYARIIA